jgi:UTP--glucose-1-phosphate uridylyltransferase
MIEKPAHDQAPSTQAIIGRYILDARIFDFLDQQQRGVDGEIQLTDAFLPLLKEQDFYGYHFKGERFDCGSKAGYIAANLRVALERDDMHSEMLKSIDYHQLSLALTKKAVHQ